MGKTYAAIDDTLAQFIGRQHMFFVATAPVDALGHINLSPKGLDSFAILDPLTVAYLDLTGSGIETIAHLRENGRIVVMFCSFEGAPNILRLHGRGAVITPEHPDFAAVHSAFVPRHGVRSVIRIRLDRISDSCGYGVPFYHYTGERSQLPDWIERKGPDALVRYRDTHNTTSIDGLPGLDTQPDPTRP